MGGSNQKVTSSKIQRRSQPKFIRFEKSGNPQYQHMDMTRPHVILWLTINPTMALKKNISNNLYIKETCIQKCLIKI